MKELHITFEDKEYRKLRKAKELDGDASWKAWILELADISYSEKLGYVIAEDERSLALWIEEIEEITEERCEQMVRDAV